MGNIKAAVAACLAFAVASEWGAASADSYVVPALDTTLIRADALLFATVSKVEALSDESAEVQLLDTVVLSSRWEAPKLWKFPVAGPVEHTDAGAIVHIPHRARLQEGHRYLFMLRGGTARLAPFEPWGVYEVSDRGEMLCAGGEIYGIVPRGFLCSRQVDQVGPPTTESQMTELLSTALTHARRRRPEAAAEADRDVQPLTTTLLPRRTR